MSDIKQLTEKIKKYSKKAETDKKLAAVIKSDPEGRYLIVKRIFGTQSALDFVQYAVYPEGLRKINDFQEISWGEFHVDQMSSLDRLKAGKLLELLRSDGAVVETPARGNRLKIINIRTFSLRQYLWDGEDWVKVDVD
jgi:hypothetical protein